MKFAQLYHQTDSNDSNELKFIFDTYNYMLCRHSRDKHQDIGVLMSQRFH